MPLDPSIILGVKGPLDWQQQSAVVQHLMGQNDLQGMQVQQARDDMATNARLKALFSQNPNATTADVMGIDPIKAGPAMRKSALEADKTRAQIVEQTSLAAKHQGEALDASLTRYRRQLDYVPDPQTAAQWLSAQYQDPITGPVVSKLGPLDQALSKIPQDPQAFSEWKQRVGMGMDKFASDQRARAGQEITAAGHANAARRLDYQMNPAGMPSDAVAPPAPPISAPPVQAGPVVPPGGWQVPPQAQAGRDNIAALIKQGEQQPNGGGMIPTASVVAGSPPPPAAPLSRPPEYATWPRPKQIDFDMRQALQQKPVGAAQQGVFDPVKDRDELRDLATQSLYNPNALAGFRRDTKSMAMIQREKLNLMREAGITSEDVVSGQAGFKADTASLNKLTPQYDAVTSFEKTAIRNGDTLMALADKVDQTGVPVIEKWIRAGRQATGDADVSKFNAQLQVYRTEAAKILTNPNLSGQLTDSARHEVEGFMQPGASAQQIRSVVTLLKNDFENRKQTLEDQIGSIRARMRDRVKPGGDTPAPQRRTSDLQKVIKFDAQGNMIQ